MHGSEWRILILWDGSPPSPRYTHSHTCGCIRVNQWILLKVYTRLQIELDKTWQKIAPSPRYAHSHTCGHESPSWLQQAAQFGTKSQKIKLLAAAAGRQAQNSGRVSLLIGGLDFAPDSNQTFCLASICLHKLNEANDFRSCANLLKSFWVRQKYGFDLSETMWSSKVNGQYEVI